MFFPRFRSAFFPGKVNFNDCTARLFVTVLVSFFFSLPLSLSDDETLLLFFLFCYSMNNENTNHRRRGRTRKLPRGLTRKLAKNTGQPRTAPRRGKARAIGRKSGPRNTNFRFTCTRKRKNRRGTNRRSWRGNASSTRWRILCRRENARDEEERERERESFWALRRRARRAFWFLL